MVPPAPATAPSSSSHRDPPVYTNLADVLGVHTDGPYGRRKHEKTGHTVSHYLQFLDLVERMLDYDPRTRIKPMQALNHPFLRDEEAGEGGAGEQPQQGGRGGGGGWPAPAAAATVAPVSSAVTASAAGAGGPVAAAAVAAQPAASLFVFPSAGGAATAAPGGGGVGGGSGAAAYIPPLAKP